MTTLTHANQYWSSRLTFLLAAIGSSVGLGNLWRFSAEAGANGGGAFILVYLLCVLLIGVPTIMAELLVGRSGKASGAVNSILDLSARSNAHSIWSLGVWTGMFGGFIIVSFYCVVAAWVMAYIPKFLLGAFDQQTPGEIAAQFDALVVDQSQLYFWFFLFAVLTIWLVSRGVNRGLELASKILMPAFFFLLLLLCLYSINFGWASGGTAKAIKFLFSPDLSKISPQIALSAMGQAFFSLGLGMAIMIAYACYLPKETNLPSSALTIGICDTSVALIAGLAIFPIVFTFDLDFQAGAGLFFQTLPIALSSINGGNIIGGAFFFMAFFAALTTAIALLEPMVAQLSEQTGKSRSFAACAAGSVMTVIGLVCLFSLEFLDFLDKTLTTTFMLPVAALLVVSFVGWRLDRQIVEDEIAIKDSRLAQCLMICTKYVSPLLITIVFVAGVHSRYFT